MAGVLSRAAGRSAAGIPPRLVLTSVRRPTFGSHANSPIPRLIHTHIIPPPRFSSWFRKQLRVMVKEAVDEELKKVRGTCLTRYETLSTRVTDLSNLSATRHAESMSMSILSQEKISQIAFKVCVTMIGLAAASNFKAEIAKLLGVIANGDSAGDSPSRQEELEKTVLDLAKSVQHLVKMIEEDRQNSSIKK